MAQPFFIEDEAALREKIEDIQLRNNYIRFTRRDFLERLLSGQISAARIDEEAAALSLDLRADAYALLFFSIPLSGSDMAQLRDALLAHFLKYPEYLPQDWFPGTYLVLIKSDAVQMDHCIRRAIRSVREQYDRLPSQHRWHMAVTSTAKNPAELPARFEELSWLWSCRHILPRQRILTRETVGEFAGSHESSVHDLDPAKLNPQILIDGMRTTDAGDISNLVADHLAELTPALKFRAFCLYLMLSARFTAAEFVAGLGGDPQEFLAATPLGELAGQRLELEDVHHYLTDVLSRAVQFRDRDTTQAQSSALARAVACIDRSFTDGKLSLEQVAAAADISPNYLSGLFRRELGCTFIDYVTQKRMTLARELLRSTSKRSGQIALEVGYRDPHYFSHLFKKTQGVSPREYRKNHS